jgi:hypothetical protein
MKKKTIVWISIIIVAIVIIAVLFYTPALAVKERFQTQEDNLVKDLNTLVTVFNDALCPAYKVLLDDKKRESDLATATAEIEQDAGGTLFPCPPPADPVQLSSTIAADTERSVNFFLKQLTDMYDTVQKELNSCTPPSEGFEDQDICPPPLGQAKSPPPKPKKKTCKDLYDLSPEEGLEILKARHEALSHLTKKPQMAESLAKIQTLTQQILDIKKKAEAGELKPNCP